MDVKELRVGNYLKLLGTRFGTQTIDLKKLILSSLLENNDSIKYFKPIPLTENWLLDFGFNIIKGWDDTFYFERSGFQIYEYSVSGYEYDGFSIKYVHQLQNLHFALTNQELTNK